MTNLLLGGLKGLRLALVLGLTGHLAVPTAAVSSKMDYLPLASVRTDPVINPTCLSDHVHTYYGVNASLRPSTAYADLRAAAGNSGAVEENKSLYWHPSVYKFSPATGLYTLAEISFATAYYVWESATTAPTTAFPNGFKMLAYGSDPKARVVATCDGQAACEREDGCATTNSFFPQDACAELEVKLIFPTCWDGVRIDSPDHIAHVSYDESEEGQFDGNCPATHPVKIPEIHL